MEEGGAWRGKISVIEMFLNQSVSVPEDAIYQDVLVDDELVGLGEADQFILLNLQPLTTLHQADNRGQFFNSVFLGKTINFPINSDQKKTWPQINSSVLTMLLSIRDFFIFQ